MGVSKVEMKYNCLDDCKQSGCPYHTAKMQYNSVCDILSFDDGNGLKFSMDINAVATFLNLTAKLASGRVELSSALRDAYEVFNEYRF